MDKLPIPKVIIPPAEQDSSGASVKNDSFLEDMGLFSHDTRIDAYSREAERHVTRRTLSPVVLPFSTIIGEQDASFEQKSSQNVAHPKVPPVQRKSVHREASDSDKRRSVKEEPPAGAAKVREKRSRNQNISSKPKPRDSETSEVQNEANQLPQERRSLVKDRTRESGCYKESDQRGKAFKENKQPSNIQKQATPPLEMSKDHPRRSDGGGRIESREIPESVALLSAVKEVVSAYTKEEGIKILRTMHELHLLSQASLIKNLMFTTDEIRKDLQLGENLGQLKALMAENERLRENFSILKMKNQDLQRRLEENENVKEENARLKLKLQELAG